MTLQEQKTFFEEEGYLVEENLLSSEELAECQTEILRLHKFAAELEAKGEMVTFNASLTRKMSRRR